MKKVILSSLAVVVFSFTSCGSDDDGGGINCISAAQELADAAQAFGSDPSTENCNAYKTVLQSFLNGGCAPDQATEDSTQQILDNLNCG